ncbi:MAG: hypothetical protein LAT62_11805 [Natronospirillum sp.]|uniref:hypothetical protein n=1 Tax=Natronospirillum sp. TaxID=2812955 RepID=UPI0025ECF392|nr:hypothetical protein [Natronospirillum sp.]MCH8552616.1 hypothetical protein [Natronospirillum sp.]
MRLSQRQHRHSAPLAWVAWLLLVWAHIVHPVHSAQLLTAPEPSNITQIEQSAEHESHSIARGPYDCPHHAEHQDSGHEHVAVNHHQAHAESAHDHDLSAHYCPHCTVAGLFWLPASDSSHPPILQQSAGEQLLPATPLLLSSFSHPQQPRAPPV